MLLLVPCRLAADDTEVYVGFNDANDGTQPNVLFVMDTSSSMNGDVIMTENFDPAQTYTGSCSSTRIYWRVSNQSVPACNTNRYFNKSTFRCNTAATALDIADTGVGTGFYQDRVARWRDHPTRVNRDKWLTLSENIHNPPHVECKADNGDHGVDAVSSETYIRNGANGPWQSGAANSKNWNRTGAVYTLYSANYLNWYHNHQTTNLGTRLEVVQGVLNDLIDSVSDINVGLMRFDSHLYSDFQDRDAQGGPVLLPVTDIDQTGTRGDFHSRVDDLTAYGSTPITETLYEAQLYFRGQDAYYGVFPNNDHQSVSESFDPGNSGKYLSPIESECGKNFIVLLSDGEPTGDDNADSKINSLVGDMSGLVLGSCDHGPDYVSGANDDTCFDELAEFMYEADHATDDLGNDLPGKQNIITYTVGFGLETYSDFLESAADHGGGKSYFANDAKELGTAFTDIVSEILSVNTTFTAPAISVNAFNRITHNNQLYFALFKPDDAPNWAGNVKKFEIGLLDGEPEFLDASNPQQAAVNPNTGFFNEDSTSFWTQSFEAPDGDAAQKGGLASRLYDLGGNPIQQDASSRKVYTYTGGTTADEKNLTHANNMLHEDNAFTQYQPSSNNPDGKITPAMLGLAVASEETEDEFLNLLKWARGVDVDDDDEDGSTTDGRRGMGAPMHSKPALVTYSKTGPVSGTQKDILFTVTNTGQLHAAQVNEATNNTDSLELFTFIPEELLANLNTWYENEPGTQSGSTSPIQYGLDGDIEVFTRDADGDHEIEPGDGDHVYLYFGQRRGGRGYYALDVTDLNEPKILWSIVGGTTTGFGELGESWSKPERHRMALDINGSVVVKDVLVFGGGYDQDNDIESVSRDPNGDDIGRAIYIVDALTGELLWWAGYSGLTGPAPDLGLDDMRYSIPSEIRVIDVEREALAQRIYVGDLGGQIFRFDIQSDGSITGGRIADLQDIDGYSGDSPAVADNRRFYYAPDVALIKPFDSQEYLSVALGSGFRAHPLNKEVKDRIYLLRDYYVNSVPTTNDVVDYSLIEVTEADLLDVTEEPNLDPGSLSSENKAKYDNGWFIDLKNEDGGYEGEKVVAKALTVQGKLLITTFTPVSDNSQQSGTCAPSQGLGKLFAINVQDGTPFQNLDGLGLTTSLTKSDRVYELTRSGLPPEVIVVYPPIPGVEPVAIVGAEITDIDLDNPTVKTYWYQDNVH
jgi:type IV pilus assembly protein PilY1